MVSTRATMATQEMKVIATAFRGIHYSEYDGGEALELLATVDMRVDLTTASDRLLSYLQKRPIRTLIAT